MKKILLSTVLSSLLLTGGLQAKESAPKDASVKEVNKVSLNNAKHNAKERKTLLVDEAVNSLKDTHESLLALEKKDIKLATEKLEAALGKLEVILASKKVPELLPIDSVIKVNEFIGTSKDVDKALNTIRTLLNKNKIQEARELMFPLQSETDITTVFYH